MNYLSVEKLTKAFGEKLLFEDISFGLSEGQKTALIARNGAGKSTLLKILAGKEIPDEGEVNFNNNIRVAFLEQNPSYADTIPIIDVLFDSDNEYIFTIKQYQECMEALQRKDNPEQQQALQHWINEMDRLNAWDYESKIREILGKFQIHELERAFGTLSGGQKKKVALARALIDEAELLILDEPTNHLDIPMIEWLEDHLSKQKLSLLIVTHDRYFLDNVCDNILELDNNSIYHYKGNYSYFLEKKAEREHNTAREIEKARSLYRKELEWIRRSPMARTSKSKARIDAFHDIKEKAFQKTDSKLSNFEVSIGRIGKKILEMLNISKKYGDEIILDNYTYTFKKGEHIGLVGPNGIGKSTFLKLIMGFEKADQGSINRGKTIHFGYYAQEGIPEHGEKRVIDIFKEKAENVQLGKKSISVSLYLSHFNFPPDLQYNFFSNLSGGEKRKLHLLLTLMDQPNFLILDEPTNDLDIYTLSLLEDFLASYQGCLLIVSHDRYFMDKLAEHIFAFEGNGKIWDYQGNYSEYYRINQARQRNEKKEEKQRKTIEKPSRPKTRPKGPTYKQRKEYESLEKEIAQLENEKKELIKKMEAGKLESDEVRKLSEYYAAIDNTLTEKESRWLELAEIIEG